MPASGGSKVLSLPKDGVERSVYKNEFWMTPGFLDGVYPDDISGLGMTEVDVSSTL